jgi:MerR family transcriptional regulator, redox-sensitive transcriptional activator SoxR
LTAETLTIGEVASLSGRRASAIRYYEDVGLLPPAMRVSGRRRYDQQAIRTLAVIGTAQRAGLSLDEIKVLLGASSDNSASIDRLRMIAEQKLPEITMLIEQTQHVQRWLEAASRCQCPSLDDCQLFVDGAEPCA